MPRLAFLLDRTIPGFARQINNRRLTPSSLTGRRRKLVV